MSIHLSYHINCLRIQIISVKHSLLASDNNSSHQSKYPPRFTIRLLSSLIYFRNRLAIEVIRFLYDVLHKSFKRVWDTHLRNHSIAPLWNTLSLSKTKIPLKLNSWIYIDVQNLPLKELSPCRMYIVYDTFSRPNWAL